MAFETNGVAMFERIGGSDAIDRLVDQFYQRVDELPEATGRRALHTRDLRPVKAMLTRFITELTGGPPLYSVERRHPRLRMHQMGVPIGEAERDTWLLCMHGALEGTVADPEARQEV